MTGRSRFFCSILRHFSNSVRLDVSATFSALDDEEFRRRRVLGSGGDARSLTPRCHPSFGACVGVCDQAVALLFKVDQQVDQVACTSGQSDDGWDATGAAAQEVPAAGRERRLRSMLRHERTASRDGPGRESAPQHTAPGEGQGQRGGGAGHAPSVTTTEGSSTGEAAGRPEGSRAAGGIWGSTVASAVGSCRLSTSQVLQMVEQHVEVLSFLHSSLPAIPEQVIEGPILSLHVRAVQRAVPLEPQMAEQLVEVPTSSASSWWSSSSRFSPSAGFNCVWVAFVVFSQDKVQQRLWLSRLPTFLLPVEVFKVYAQDKVQQRLPRRSFPLQVRVVEVSWWSSRFPPLQGSAATFPVPLGDAGEGFFRTFPRVKKVRRMVRRRSTRTRTRSLFSSLLSGSSSVTPLGKTFYWNRAYFYHLLEAAAASESSGSAGEV